MKIFVSGGIDEGQIPELNPYVESYGIGTSISNAPVIDFAMDIVEMEGQPMAKRGKLSGAKRLFRCRKCRNDQKVPYYQSVKKCACGGRLEEILVPLLQKGKRLVPAAKPGDIRDFVLEQVGDLPPLSTK